MLSYINSLTVIYMRFGKELSLMHVFNFCLFISLPIFSSFPLIPSRDIEIQCRPVSLEVLLQESSLPCFVLLILYWLFPVTLKYTEIIPTVDVPLN